MIDTLSYKAAHHQNQTIEHLKYENELLLKRNQVLSLENAKLLQELHYCFDKIQTNQAANIEKMTAERQELIEIAKKDCTVLFHGIDRKMQKNIGGIVSSYQQTLSNKQCSLSYIYKSLSEIIGRLLRQKSEDKQNKLREYINTTQQRLLMRKTARDTTNQVVHLIKQPPKEINTQYRHMMQEINLQADIYHRIIRKVKRQTINVHSLQGIYHQISELTETRWRLKLQQNKLIVLQREFQLGNFHPLDQQTTSSLIKSLGQSLKEMKVQLQQKIKCLS